ncbi:TPA: hypothetical protein ACPZPF_002311 [Yersinia enterocolitica]
MSEIKQYDTEVRLEAVMGTNHYGVHIHAMTTEDLHSKSGIAVELAWRDLRIEQLITQLEAAQLDATRWRALLSSPAIRILGHAGLQDDKPIDGHYCHFGMEIWSHHEPYYDNKKAGELITRYADNMIAAGFTVKEDATPIVIVPAPAGVIMRPQYEKPLERCAAGRDGECHHKDCPQLRDNEPMATGRHCPIDNWDDE